MCAYKAVLPVRDRWRGALTGWVAVGGKPVPAPTYQQWVTSLCLTITGSRITGLSLPTVLSVRPSSTPLGQVNFPRDMSISTDYPAIILTLGLSESLFVGFCPCCIT